jgi:hypothetical protein
VHKSTQNRNFSIPAETELLGRKIKVFHTPYLKSGSYGHTSLITSNIHIAATVDGVIVPDSEKEITYLHEIAHLILAKNNYEKKIRRAGIDLESLVEDIAVGMHQVLTKAKSRKDTRNG